ncbi:MAG TPA: type II CAAX endopeptidase family protein [Rubrobacteraceae bacterium]|nr:type II CAAX endopeptidase family protein [Rubrobacteraceae bacterium]
MRLILDGGRLRAPWRLLLQYLLFWASLQVLLSALAAAYLSSYPDRSASSSLSSFQVLLGSVAALTATLLSVWVAGRFLDRRPFADFGFRLGRGWWFDLAFGLALGAALMTAIFLAELGLGWVSISGAFEVADAGTPFALALLLPLGTFVCVGVYEELIFRGYQIKNASEGLDFPAIGPRGAVLLAWLLTSAFFGYQHAGNPGATALATLNIALAGLMLGLGYVLNGELAIPIGLHVSWNLFQGGVYGFPVSGLDSLGASFVAVEQSGPELWTGGSFGPEAGLLGVVAMLLGALLITLWVRLRHGRVALHASLAEDPKRALPSNDPSETGRS